MKFASSHRVSERSCLVIVAFQAQVLSDVIEQMGALYFSARTPVLNARAMRVKTVELRLRQKGRKAEDKCDEMTSW